MLKNVSCNSMNQKSRLQTCNLCWYMQKFLVLIFLSSFLIACSGSAINRIGWRVPLDNQVDVVCIAEALKSNSHISEIKKIENTFMFMAGDYRSSITFSPIKNGISHFDIEVDGMSLGEETGLFYVKAENVSTNIQKSIKDVCSGSTAYNKSKSF